VVIGTQRLHNTYHVRFKVCSKEINNIDELATKIEKFEVGIENVNHDAVETSLEKSQNESKTFDAIDVLH